MEKNKNELLSKTSVVCILAFLCCGLWGSAFPCIKIGYEMFQIASNDIASQILFAGLRFTLAGVLVIIIGSLGNKKMLLPEKKSIPKIIKLSLFQTILQYFFFYVGLAHTSGVKASIIEAANVFIAILVSSLIFRLERFTVRKMAGCVIGFLGVILINLGRAGLDMDFTWVGEGFILISTVAYAISSVLIKYYAKEESPVLLSGYQFSFGGVVMIGYGILAGGTINKVTGEGIAMLCYLALISAVAYTLWSLLLKYNPVSKVAVFGFMNPVCGVLLSALLLGEGSQAFGIQGVAALFLACIGIYIVNRK